MLALALALAALSTHLLTLVAGQVHHAGKVLHVGALVPNVVDADLGLGHAAAVARLDVRLVLAVPGVVAEGGGRCRDTGMGSRRGAWWGDRE